jgi:hypothetical protein
MNLDINVVAIIHWGRPGCLFTGNLFDNHKNTLIIHDVSLMSFFGNSLFKNATNISSLIDDVLDNHKAGTASYTEKGKKEITIQNLKDILLDLSTKYDLFDKRIFFIAIHYAYYIYNNQDISNKTMIIYHLHLLNHSTAKEFLEFFPKAKFIGMRRESIIKASASNMKLSPTSYDVYDNYNNALSFVTRGKYFFRYTHALSGWKFVAKELGIEVYDVVIDEINKNPNETILKLITYLSLPWSDTLLSSTIFGETFLGIPFQTDLIKGFNPSLSKSFDHTIYYNSLDKLVIEQMVGLIHKQYSHLVKPEFNEILFNLIEQPTKLEAKALDQATSTKDYKEVLIVIHKRVAFIKSFFHTTK